MKQIKSALISVYHKATLEPIVRELQSSAVRIYSTGGTYKHIEGMGVEVSSVESLTTYPSLLGGRVKTLHPLIFGGILGRRDHQQDQEDFSKYDIPAIDLVIVDLYPFEETLFSGASEEEIIEKVDIGGISLIRAAAKNYRDVLVIPSSRYYDTFLEIFRKQSAATTIEQRKRFAAAAFGVSSHYDTAIFNYFNQDSEINELRISRSTGHTLRYGENPHQKGFFYGQLGEAFEQLHGKAISYNNIVDIDAGVHLVEEFEGVVFAVLKHTNACGLAERANVVDAWRAALAGDPVSAFGGVLVTNATINREVAEAIDTIFFEVLLAPGFDEDALRVLKQKKNRILLKQKQQTFPGQQLRSMLNGYLWQQRDRHMVSENSLKVVTKKVPGQAQISDLLFGMKAVKHTKSNAIVLAKEGQLIGSGIGQTSRVDALKQAIEKARNFGFDLQGAVMASDAFFPFADSVELAHKAGITAVIQPGGSKRDQDSIDYCNDNQIAMAFTGIRHFKH
ncbi:MAG: bifunctional phosphoribosylaminoimidazolecarboxamide formyltransferase/IMP cyclohydrolase [Bacteroidales bacterium]